MFQKSVTKRVPFDLPLPKSFIFQFSLSFWLLSDRWKQEAFSCKMLTCILAIISFEPLMKVIGID